MVRENKNISIFSLLVLLIMWIIFAFSENNPDMAIYSSIYKYLENGRGFFYPGIELGFSLIMKISSSLGFSFSFFIVCLGTISILLLGRLVYNYSNNPTLVFLMYAFFPFLLDIVQVRNFLSSLIVLNGLQFLSEKKFLKYIILVVVASFFHISALFYLLFILTMFEDKKKLSIYILAFSFIMFIFKNQIVQILIAVLPNGGKYVVYLGGTNNIVSLLFFALFLANVIISLGLARGNVILDKKINSLSQKQKNFTELVGKINIIVCVAFVFTLFDIDFFRLFRNIFILNYIVFSNSFYKGITSRESTTIVCNILFVLFVALTGYAFLYLNQTETVIKTIIENNTIINFFLTAN